MASLAALRWWIFSGFLSPCVQQNAQLLGQKVLLWLSDRLRVLYRPSHILWEPGVPTLMLKTHSLLRIFRAAIVAKSGYSPPLAPGSTRKGLTRKMGCMSSTSRILSIVGKLCPLSALVSCSPRIAYPSKSPALILRQSPKIARGMPYLRQSQSCVLGASLVF